MILALLLFAVPMSAHAGVNQDGTLILHAPFVIRETNGTWCGLSALASCELAHVNLPWAADSTTVFYVMAAFPDTASPRLLGVSFGIDYDSNRFQMAGWENCGSFQLATGDWPDPGSGNP